MSHDCQSNTFQLDLKLSPQIESMPGNLNLVDAQGCGCPRSQKKSTAIALYKYMVLNSLSDMCIYAHRLVLLSIFVRDTSACSGQN